MIASDAPLLGVTAHGRTIHLRARPLADDKPPWAAACGCRSVVWYRRDENPDFVDRMRLPVYKGCDAYAFRPDEQ